MVMSGATFECAYEGGFAKMPASPIATLKLDGEGFVIQRPVRFFSLSRNIRKIWAKWSAVTGVVVSPAPDGGAQLELTTKVRGTGRLRLADTDPADLRATLDALADVKARFAPYEPVADDGPTGSADEPGDGEPTAGGRPSSG